jgi:hypothetical protein
VREYLRPAGLFFATFLLVAFVTGVVAAFNDRFKFLMAFAGIPLALAVLAAGAVFLLIRGFRIAWHMPDGFGQAVAVLASPLLLVATLAAALPVLWSGGHVGDLARLAINRDRYDAMVAKVSVNPRTLSFENEAGLTYSVDPGPPVRVAFNPAGLLDNWSGIVFDPTGEVMLADGFDPDTGEFAAPDRITGLFGGDLVGCRHLWDSYYKCSFT